MTYSIRWLKTFTIVCFKVLTNPLFSIAVKIRTVVAIFQQGKTVL